MAPPCPRHALLGAQMNDERSDLRLIPPRAGRAETDDIRAPRRSSRVFFFLCNLYYLIYLSVLTHSTTDPVWPFHTRCRCFQCGMFQR